VLLWVRTVKQHVGDGVEDEASVQVPLVDSVTPHPWADEESGGNKAHERSLHRETQHEKVKTSRDSGFSSRAVSAQRTKHEKMKTSLDSGFSP
jgi:hypothetical protein